jgi:hypothetical protein
MHDLVLVAFAGLDTHEVVEEAGVAGTKDEWVQALAARRCVSERDKGLREARRGFRSRHRRAVHEGELDVAALALEGSVGAFLILVVRAWVICVGSPG